MYWTHPPDKLPDTYTLRYALDKLQCAHRYLMASGRIWYDLPGQPDTQGLIGGGLKEADKLICVAASDIRIAARTSRVLDKLAKMW